MDNLSHLINKKRDPITVLKSIASAHTEQYSKSLCIYTDASKTKDGRVAAAFYIENDNYGLAKRLSDNSTIYVAEFAAIEMAVDWLSGSVIEINSVIFTDSMSSVISIKTGSSQSRPNALKKLIDKINLLTRKPLIVWILSHVGIPGNSAADKLAKLGTCFENIEIETDQELSEECNNVDSYILKEWQIMHSSSLTGQFYRLIEPEVSTKIKFKNSNRRKERLITRLRLGKCSLNKYLYDINLHHNGLCDTCNRPESVEHFLLECPHNRISESIKKKCRQLGIPSTIQNILRDSRLVDEVYSLICNIDRNL